MTTAKRIHLWENHTWDERGGNWVALRAEEWAEVQAIVAVARDYVEAIRVTGYIKGPLPGEFDTLADAVKEHDANVASALAVVAMQNARRR